MDGVLYAYAAIFEYAFPTVWVDDMLLKLMPLAGIRSLNHRQFIRRFSRISMISFKLEKLFYESGSRPR